MYGRAHHPRDAIIAPQVPGREEDTPKTPPAASYETVAMNAPIQSPLPERYEVIGELGRGGMGIVYEARDRETGEHIAIKVLKPEIAADTQILERFKNELRLAHKITHRNVARLNEYHRSGDIAYLSMEFVPGDSLRAVLKREGRLSVDRVLALARQLAAGLAEAHRQSIAHRDLKPENIMITPQGEAKIMDFGISRAYDSGMTLTGVIVGTPAYMAPEQAEGKPTDQRTDIYALGLILYEMLTGVQAFTGDTPTVVALRQIRELPEPPRKLAPDLPAHIEQAILRAVAKKPEDRFQSMEEFARALEGLVEAPPRTTIPSRRGRIAMVAVGAAVVIASLVLVYFRMRVNSDIMHFPIEAFTLPNGLRVVLSEDHAAPTVTVAVSYNAGSRYEQTGKAGLAHIVEHLMYEGSTNVARGEFAALVQGAGGNMNGHTTPDCTLMFATLPANQLELALFLEADRMRDIEITPEGLESARLSLIEERRTRVDNVPYGPARLRVRELLFESFGNRQSGLGEVADIRTVTLHEARAFYQKYYGPSNASLAVVGDFQPAALKQRIRHHFEPIPARPKPAPPDTPEPGYTTEKRSVFVDSTVRVPVRIIAYRAPGASTADWFALKSAIEVLGGGEWARLQRRLVKEAGVAMAIEAFIEESSGLTPAVFSLIPAPGKDLGHAERLFEEEISRIQKEGIPEADLERRRTTALLRRALQLANTRTRAIMLARFSIAYDRPAILNEWSDRELSITSDQMRDVARKYLVPGNRIVLEVDPPGRTPGVLR